MIKFAIDDAIKERWRNRIDELDHRLGAGTITDDIAQPVGGNVRIFVGHVNRQTINLPLKALNTL